MQELVGRLTALDPEASESLKVIAYFDALVEGHAGLEVLLRGAAVLSGCGAGFRHTQPALAMAVDASGRRLPAPAAGEPGPAAPTHPLPGGGVVWLDRAGPAHANDAMVLERLAIGLAISIDRRAERMRDTDALERGALETLLDADEPSDARTAAARRLRLDTVPLAQIAASPASEASPAPREVVLTTSVGRVRARLVVAGTEPRVDGEPPTRTGIGVATPPTDLATSWRTALLALRMTAPREPLVRAEELGVVLLAAEAVAADPGRPAHPDVAALDRIAEATARGTESRGADALDLLDALARAESVRAAAALAGVHHSTMQARAADFCGVLGFDPRTPAGRVRLSDALRLHRLTTAQFD